MQKYVFLFRVYPPSLSSLWLCEHTGFRKIHTKPLPLCKRRNGWDFDLVYICLCWWCGLRTQRAHRTRTILNVCGLKWKLNKKNSKQYALLLVHIVEGVRGTKRYYAKRSTSNGEVSDLKREHFLISILSWCLCLFVKGSFRRLFVGHWASAQTCTYLPFTFPNVAPGTIIIWCDGCIVGAYQFSTALLDRFRRVWCIVHTYGNLHDGGDFLNDDRSNRKPSLETATGQNFANWKISFREVPVAIGCLFKSVFAVNNKCIFFSVFDKVFKVF